MDSKKVNEKVNPEVLANTKQIMDENKEDEASNMRQSKKVKEHVDLFCSEKENDDDKKENYILNPYFHYCIRSEHLDKDGEDCGTSTSEDDHKDDDKIVECATFKKANPLFWYCSNNKAFFSEESSFKSLKDVKDYITMHQDYKQWDVRIFRMNKDDSIISFDMEELLDLLSLFPKCQGVYLNRCEIEVITNKRNVLLPDSILELSIGSAFIQNINPLVRSLLGSKIEVLNLQKNKITSMVNLIENLKYITNLKYVHLRQNIINDMDECLLIFAENVSYFRERELGLNLEENNFNRQSKLKVKELHDLVKDSKFRLIMATSVVDSLGGGVFLQ